MRVLRWLLMIIMLLLSACAGKTAMEWQDIPEPTVLLAELQSRSGLYRRLDAAAQVGLKTEGKYFSSQQFIVLERPDRLRLDVLTGFGQLVLQLASDGHELAVFDNRQVPGQFFHGPASEKNIGRFIRLPLPVRDLLPVLLYAPPLIAFDHSRSLTSDSRLILAIEDGDRLQELDFDQNYYLLGCRYFYAGQLQLEVEYHKFDPVDHFPRTIRIRVPGTETLLTLTYSELKLNSAIDASRFRLDAPMGSIEEVLP